LPENYKSLTLEQSLWLDQALNTLNTFIDQRIESYKEKEKKISDANLGHIHAVAHGVLPTKNDASSLLTSSSPQYREGEFLKPYQASLSNFDDNKNILRHYQLAGIKTISGHDKPNCCILNATCCGKSMILYKLAVNAFLMLNPGEFVVVVTPQKELANQLYKDFIEYHEKFEEARFSHEAIITVSSDYQSCSMRVIVQNHSLMRKKTILIFCLESFIEFFKIQAFKDGIRLALFDEFHDYPGSIKEFVKEQPKDSLMIGCSGTLPIENPLRAPIYTYDIRQAITEGFLAPIIVDGLGVNYSRKKVVELIDCLPILLQRQYHPGFNDTTTLATTKGIIFLPKIKDCERAANILKNANIPCYVINSKNPECRKELKTFLAMKKGIVLAVQMLRFGFNDVDLGWVIVAQNLNKLNDLNHHNLLMQMIGRALRMKNDKMAYVITFDDTKLLIDQYLKDVPHTLSASIDYLSQANAYYFDDSHHIWKVADGDDLPKGKVASFRIDSSADYGKRRFQGALAAKDKENENYLVGNDKSNNIIEAENFFVKTLLYANNLSIGKSPDNTGRRLRGTLFNQHKFGRR
jgi:superfamily II DNA or RNA helicase